jgi:hypothetical protein
MRAIRSFLQRLVDEIDDLEDRHTGQIGERRIAERRRP